MDKTENMAALERALKDYLQPIFDKHFTLETWAYIWAYKVFSNSSYVFDDLLGYLPAVYEIYGSAYCGSDSNPWDAACEFWIGIGLKQHDLRLKVFINKGIVISVEPDEDELSDKAYELDLAKEFEKHLTWVALSK
jgi:hypothetical protein